VNGTLNSVIFKRCVSSNQSVILSFNLERETYKKVLPPEHECVNCQGLQYEGARLCTDFDSELM